MAWDMFCDQQIDVFESFRCVTGHCLYSCCANWQIIVDDNCLQELKDNPSRLAKKTLKNMEQSQASTFFKLGLTNRCRLLQRDMLCSIQCSLPAECIPLICKKFPRIDHDNGVIHIRSLTISCSEAARLILSKKDGVVFRPMATDQLADAINAENSSLSPTDAYIAYAECAVHAHTLQILRNRTLPLPNRLGIIALMLEQAEAIELHPENDSQLQRVLASFSDAHRSASYAEELNTYTCDVATRKQFEDWMASDLRKHQIQSLPVKNVYAKPVRRLARFVQYTSAFFDFDHRHIPLLLREYDYLFENYLVLLLYNTLFPYEHENFRFAYQYLILRFYMVLVFTSHFYKDATTISETDVIFALSYYSRLYEHIEERSVIFYGFLDQHGHFDLATALSMLRSL